MRQHPTEDEASYDTRFITAQTRAGSFMEESELLTTFIESLDNRLQPRMRAYWVEKPDVGIVDVFRRYETEGETMRLTSAPRNPERGVLHDARP